MNEKTTTVYTIHMEPRFGPLQRFDVQAIADACKEAWTNETICKVNDSLLRLGVVQGEFHWHKHDDEDELFYVVDGRLLLDLEDRTVELLPRQGFLVPKGVVHRTRSPERSIILMMASVGVVPTGD